MPISKPLYILHIARMQLFFVKCILNGKHKMSSKKVFLLFLCVWLNLICIIVGKTTVVPCQKWQNKHLDCTVFTFLMKSNTKTYNKNIEFVQ